MSSAMLSSSIMTPEAPETPWSPEEGTYPAQQTPIVVNFGPPTNPTDFETDLPSELIHRGWRKFWSQRENRPFFFHQMSGNKMWEMPPIYNDLPYNSNEDPYQHQQQNQTPLGPVLPFSSYSSHSSGNSVGHQASPVVDQGDIDKENKNNIENGADKETIAGIEIVVDKEKGVVIVNGVNKEDVVDQEIGVQLESTVDLTSGINDENLIDKEITISSENQFDKEDRIDGKVSVDKKKGDGKKSRRRRTSFTLEQKVILKAAFMHPKSKGLSPNLIDYLARKTNLPSDVIINWFRNRRSEQKKMEMSAAKAMKLTKPNPNDRPEQSELTKTGDQPHSQMNPLEMYPKVEMIPFHGSNTGFDTDANPEPEQTNGYLDFGGPYSFENNMSKMQSNTCPSGSSAENWQFGPNGSNFGPMENPTISNSPSDRNSPYSITNMGQYNSFQTTQGSWEYEYNSMQYGLHYRGEQIPDGYYSAPNTNMASGMSTSIQMPNRPATAPLQGTIDDEFASFLGSYDPVSVQNYQSCQTNDDYCNFGKNFNDGHITNEDDLNKFKAGIPIERFVDDFGL